MITVMIWNLSIILQPPVYQNPPNRAEKIGKVVEIAKPVVEKAVKYYKDSQAQPSLHPQSMSPQPKGFSGTTFAAGVIGGAAVGAAAAYVISDKSDKVDKSHPNEDDIPLDSGSFTTAVQSVENDDIPLDQPDQQINVNDNIPFDTGLSDEPEQKQSYSSDISFDSSNIEQ